MPKLHAISDRQLNNCLNTTKICKIEPKLIHIWAWLPVGHQWAPGVHDFLISLKVWSRALFSRQLLSRNQVSHKYQCERA